MMGCVLLFPWYSVLLYSLPPLVSNFPSTFLLFPIFLKVPVIFLSRLLFPFPTMLYTPPHTLNLPSSVASSLRFFFLYLGYLFSLAHLRFPVSILLRGPFDFPFSLMSGASGDVCAATGLFGRDILLTSALLLVIIFFSNFSILCHKDVAWSSVIILFTTGSFFEVMYSSLIATVFIFINTSFNPFASAVQSVEVPSPNGSTRQKCAQCVWFLYIRF